MTRRPGVCWTAVAATTFQRDFWFLGRVTGGGTYNIAATAPWPAAPDLAAVAGIAAEIAGRQPALRTRLALGDDDLYALVGDQPGSQLDVAAIRAPPGEWDTIVARLVGEPIDPGAGGTVRVRLLCAPSGTARICLIGHHALLDGRSLAAMLSEMCAAARGGPAGGARYEPGVSAAAHLIDFRRRHDDDFQFWGRQLRGTVLPAPASLNGRSAGTGLVALRLGQAQREAVTGFAAAHRSSAFLVLVAAFLAALRNAADGEDLVIGIPVDGRPATAGHDEFGCFTTVLPIRVGVTGPAATGAAVMHDRLREVFLDALDHTAITARDLQSLARRAGLAAPYRYLATMLACADDIHPISGGPKGDLTLTLMDRDGITDCHFVYRPAAFTETQVTSITAAFVRLLAAL